MTGRLPLALGACLISGVAAAVAPAGATARFDPSLSDARAILLADRVLEALGGREAWEGTRYVLFDFVVERDGRERARRTHLWDRWDGRLRYERQEEGKPLVVLMNVNTHEGSAFLGGRALDAAATKPRLTEAYEAWINDSYWVFMPFKMKDPGVRLSMAEPVDEAGTTYDRVVLSFDGVGLTPGDRYWAYVNRGTGIMDRWAYVLEDEPPDGEPTVWEWRGWQRRGPLLLSPEKVLVTSEATTKILHPRLLTFAALPDRYFASPDPLPATLAP